MLSSNPYQRRLPLRERAARATRAFEAADARIAACVAASPQNPTYAALAGEVAGVKPVSTRLRRDPDTLDEVMDLVFRIEEATSGCPNPTDLDRALALLAASRQSAEQ